MLQLSHASAALMARALSRQTPQTFGSCFQHAVATALGRIEAYRGCYDNRGAGQPDIIAGRTGIEVKSSKGSQIQLQGNYAAIRQHYDRFRLIGLRTDLFVLWALVIPDDAPPSVTLGRTVSPDLASDEALETGLARELAWVLETTGTPWSDAQTPDAARDAIDRACAPG